MILDLWISFLVITAICVVGALVRKYRSADDLTYPVAFVYAAISAFAALCITLIINALGVNLGRWDEVIVAVLYVIVVPPTNMLGMR
jgi:hypothetical protein